MANMLKLEKQAMVIGALAEGNSIRSIERMTGVHRDTVMRLGVHVGQECAKIMDGTMKNLDSRVFELDEIWGFVGKKQKNLTKEDDPMQVGDTWTFVAIDADSKLVPCFRVGKRDQENARAFVVDLAGRLSHRVQVSTDALSAYEDAIEEGFGGDVDYAQIIKSYTEDDHTPKGKYSPGKIIKVEKTEIVGNPVEERISTSYVECQNLTMRMHIRRLTRLTNAFSKKLENFKAAIGLYFGYYNFVKMHKTLRMTPAMAAGVSKHVWNVRELVEMTV